MISGICVERSFSLSIFCSYMRSICTSSRSSSSRLSRLLVRHEARHRPMRRDRAHLPRLHTNATLIMCSTLTHISFSPMPYLLGVARQGAPQSCAPRAVLRQLWTLNRATLGSSPSHHGCAPCATLLGYGSLSSAALCSWCHTDSRVQPACLTSFEFSFPSISRIRSSPRIVVAQCAYNPFTKRLPSALLLLFEAVHIPFIKECEKHSMSSMDVDAGAFSATLTQQQWLGRSTECVHVEG